jgi:hypothetical protein
MIEGTEQSSTAHSSSFSEYHGKQQKDKVAHESVVGKGLVVSSEIWHEALW